MFPRIDRKRICKQCSSLIKQPLFSSKNTFGAKFWTDGRIESTMHPEDYLYIKCPHCNTFLWIDEQDEVFNKKDAKLFLLPTFDDYILAINDDEIGFEKKKYLHLQAWWNGNDIRRNSKYFNNLSEIEQDNIKTLLNFLKYDNEEECIMIAEIYRELQEFENAINMFYRFIDDEINDLYGLKIFILRLIKNRVSVVMEIPSDKS